MLLDKQKIKNADDVQKEDVPVPEWGGTIRLQGLSGEGRDAFEKEWDIDPNNPKKFIAPDNVRARLVALCAIDENGNRLMDESDIDWLGKKAGVVLDRLFKAAQRLSGLDPAAAEAAKGN